MPVSEYLRAARRWWWVAAICVLACAGGAWGYTSAQQPVYRASATILVNQSQNPGVASYQDILGSQQLTKTYAQLATSDVNLLRALEQLQLHGMTLEKLDAKVSANAMRDTQLIQIHAEDTDPERAALIANTVAQLFPDSIEQAQLAGASPAPGAQLDTVFVAKQARVPVAPVRPSLATNVALGIMLGLVVAAAAIAVLDYHDDGINGRDELAALKLPFLGQVVQVERPGGADDDWVPSLITAQGELPGEAALAESYRQVQAALSFALGATDAKVLLVTSSTPGEGKTTTSVNLALSLSQSARRVLLIDADLRKPDVHRYFGIEPGAGLSTSFLADRASLPSFVKYIGDTLWILTAGPVPPNPAELLASPKAEAIIAAIKKPFDIVIIDCPPVLGLADSSLLMNAVDGVILVARKGKTRRKHLLESVEAVQRSSKPLIGVVVNGTTRKSGGSYGYGYGYNYGYGERRRKRSRSKAA